MTENESALTPVLRAEIVARGPMPFRRFMEQALYHPELGYYSSGHARIGRKGDFFTNVSVGPIFGRMLALQFAEMWERLGCPAGFDLVEQGAHDGEFARDVLDFAKQELPRFAEAIRYTIIEPFPALRARQQEKLAGAASVRWLESLDALQPFTGVHFSNELLDAMPVHVVRRTRTGWLEKLVALDASGGFTFAGGPLSEPRLDHLLARLPPDLPEGYETEVNPTALDWIDSLVSRMVRGYLLAIDYGYPREIYYQPSRHTGTLLCYSKHHRVASPLEEPGMIDMTAHVDFTTVTEQALRRGMRLAGFTDQHHFFTGLASRYFAPDTARTEQDRRGFKTLMHPEFLGARFKVLALAADAPVAPPLSGLTFGRQPAVALGLSSSFRPA